MTAIVSNATSFLNDYTNVAKEKFTTYQAYAIELAQETLKKAKVVLGTGKTLVAETTQPVTNKVYGVYLGAHHTVFTVIHFITESSKKSIDYSKETASSVFVNAKKRAEQATVKTIDLSKAFIPTGIYTTVESTISTVYNGSVQTLVWTKEKVSDPLGSLKAVTPVFVVSFVTAGLHTVSGSYQIIYAGILDKKKAVQEKVLFFYNRFMMGLNKVKKDQ